MKSKYSVLQMKIQDETKIKGSVYILSLPSLLLDSPYMFQRSSWKKGKALNFFHTLITGALFTVLFVPLYIHLFIYFLCTVTVTL